MDLKSGYPYWTVKNGLLANYPALREDLACDVVVVGAGITGALIADRLVRAGFEVCVIDRREAGWGSTSASTGLLQYEIDVELAELSAHTGEADAVLVYRQCEQAIPALLRLARELGKVDVRPMQSLYYASRWHHRSRLLKEAALRQSHGFDVRVLDRAQILDRYGFEAPVALLTRLAAQVDPYQMAHRLLARVVRRGGRVFDRTTMASFDAGNRGVKVRIDNAGSIRCRQLILAAGYEGQRLLAQRVARNRSSYAFVSDPLPDGPGPLADCLVWESARPYLYVRSTRDGRVIVGGDDDRIDLPIKRDALVALKVEKLRKRAANLFPSLPLEPAFGWAGTFAETEDGLPFFGPHPQHGSRVHFAMAYGGNGIVYSQIGAELLCARLEGRKHPCDKLFSFDRLNRS
ncbi:NAD(P)/FAD-dependent oxidoreductase [Dokdonella sp.]|uniref:NAD(P)/FAD-dependent oxidoreductase n=1 Tax=Dokdonella sp. TaxID=2291710 RepID=UPI00378395B2